MKKVARVAYIKKCHAVKTFKFKEKVEVLTKVSYYLNQFTRTIHY